MKKYVSVLLALIGFSFAIYWVVISARKTPAAPPLREPAQSSYNQTIAGAGIIEAANRNINLSPPIPGQVTKIFVKENDLIKRGSLLYQIDDREHRARLERADADIARAKAAIITAQSEIADQEAAQLNARAIVEELNALLKDAETIAESNEKLYQDGVLPKLTFTSSAQTRDASRARVKQAEAEVIRAEARLHTASARLHEAQANLTVLQAQRHELVVTMDRLSVVAPSDGRVLQVNIRPGEFVSSTPQISPILFGDTDYLQVRVDIDEVNASRVEPGSNAIAHLKGDVSKKIELEFVRIDPYITPKRSLTGDNTERVDVRVLQVIYRFRPPQFNLYVGQQVDVFIDATNPVTNPAVSQNR
jgi:HlyD family secretion protein